MTNHDPPGSGGPVPPGVVVVFGHGWRSFATPNGDENADSGRLLRCYSQSPFLDYVARTTVATAEFPAPYTHARVLSQSQIVDVVSTGVPTFRVLQRR